jgi:hypothetical protein
MRPAPRRLRRPPLELERASHEPTREDRARWVTPSLLGAFTDPIAVRCSATSMRHRGLAPIVRAAEGTRRSRADREIAIRRRRGGAGDISRRAASGRRDGHPVAGASRIAAADSRTGACDRVPVVPSWRRSAARPRQDYGDTSASCFARSPRLHIAGIEWPLTKQSTCACSDGRLVAAHVRGGTTDVRRPSPSESRLAMRATSTVRRASTPS